MKSYNFNETTGLNEYGITRPMQACLSVTIVGSIIGFLLFQVWCGYQTYISRLYLNEKVAQEEAVLAQKKKELAEVRANEIREITLLNIELEQIQD